MQRSLGDMAPQRWKNGGGLTRELLAWPDAGDWQLRISVARIEADGPFSAFPGVERWFAVLGGAGVRLAFGARTETLRVGDREPLVFDGTAAPGCTLVDGPTEDLNLMLREGSGRALLRRAQVGEAWADAAPLRALYCHAAARLQAGHGTFELAAAGLLFDTDAADQAWRLLAAAGSAWWLSFDPARTR